MSLMRARRCPTQRGFLWTKEPACSGGATGTAAFARRTPTPAPTSPGAHRRVPCAMRGIPSLRAPGPPHCAAHGERRMQRQRPVHCACVQTGGRCACAQAPGQRAASPADTSRAGVLRMAGSCSHQQAGGRHAQMQQVARRSLPVGLLATRRHLLLGRAPPASRGPTAQAACGGGGMPCVRARQIGAARVHAVRTTRFAVRKQRATAVRRAPRACHE